MWCLSHNGDVENRSFEVISRLPQLQIIIVVIIIIIHTFIQTFIIILASTSVPSFCLQSNALFNLILNWSSGSDFKSRGNSLYNFGAWYVNRRMPDSELGW